MSKDKRAGVSHLAWAIHDLSITGAFIETHGPLEVGTVIGLEIQLPVTIVHVEAKVERIQAPCWEHVAGLGVSFTSFAEGHDARLRSFIDARKRTIEAARTGTQKPAA